MEEVDVLAVYEQGGSISSKGGEAAGLTLSSFQNHSRFPSRRGKDRQGSLGQSKAKEVNHLLIAMTLTHFTLTSQKPTV